ncbi:MAG: hypothetical protein JOZ76_18405 [Bradyrhizobium sp.]|nr:hypothetical protein [Bradyrhizobium sp.]
MPPDPDELLQQADALAASDGATQSDLRRAISTAYYAVFHFCLTAAADMVCGSGSRSTPRYSLVYRSVDHKTLSGLCGQLSQTKPQNVAIMPADGLGSVADFARVTANLQRQRILADYDPSQSFSEAEAKLTISEARQAINWFGSSSDEQKEAFLTMLLFRQR